MGEYEIETTGVIDDETDPSRATTQFARVFKVDIHKAKMFVNSGKPKRVGKNLSRERAERYLDVLEKIGIGASVNPPFIKHSRRDLAAVSTGQGADAAVNPVIEKLNIDSGAATLILSPELVDHPENTEAAPDSRIHSKTASTSSFLAPWRRIGESVNPAGLGGKSAVLLVMIVWGLLLIQTDFRVTTGLLPEIGVYSSFMGGVTMALHEAGHVLFSFFGRFMTVLGGSLFQLLVPAALTLGFVYWYKNTFAAAVTTWWLGFSCMDLAPYIHDAKERQLLLGHRGSEVPGSHDWNYLLRWTDSLDSYESIAVFTNFTGELLVVLSILWGGYLLGRQFRSRQSAGSSFHKR